MVPIAVSVTGNQPLLSQPEAPAAATERSSSTLHQAIDVAGLSGRKPAVVALFAALAYVFTGTVGFHLLLNLTWASSFYFAVTTSLTVGYGDIDAWSPMDNSTSGNVGIPYTPTDGAILFTTLYIIGGMIIMGTSLGLILHMVLEGAMTASKETDRRPGFVARHPLLASSALCLVSILVGAAFIASTEGVDLVHGIYWAVVTMSTVGYGSGTPHTDGTRTFAAFYMLFGVSCMANFVGELADRPLRAHRLKLETQVINQYGDSLEEGELWELESSEQFHQLDLKPSPFEAGRGVSRDAFSLIMLVRTGKLCVEDLKRCQAAFDALDADGSYTLDVADIEEHKRRARPAAAERRSTQSI